MIFCLYITDKFQFAKENQHDKRTGTAGNPDSRPRRTHYGGYCELYPVRQGKGLFSDRTAGYGDCEIECGEEVGVLGMLAWQIGSHLNKMLYEGKT